MSNRAFGELSSYEKILVFWMGAGIVLSVICWLIGYKVPDSWAWAFGLIALYLGGVIWEEKITDLKRRVDKLEERIDHLEKRG
jgi:uncharacterized membrane protein YfcA